MKKIWTIVAAMAATLCATAQNSENGHEWVDLGLPSGLKWATMNVGATTPEGYGNAYAWGETEPKTRYDFTTYKYGDGTTFSKYNNTDGKEVLDLEDDAARVNWGGSWRMPTAADFEELLNNCTWIYNESNGGYTVQGSNGNTIFLPKTNFYYGTNPSDWAGFYRTSNLSDTQWKASKYFAHWDPEWGQNGIAAIDIERGHGMAVRPVCIPTKWYAVEVKTDLEGGSVTADFLKAKEGDLVTLTIAPATGYELAKIEVKDADNQAVTLVGDKFTMPASAVSVSAEFVKTNYTITVAEIENGTVEANHQTAQLGDEITLTIEPTIGYELAKIEVKDADNQAVELDGDKFTMPASAVKVRAEFVKTNYTITVAEIENGTVEANHQTAQLGDEITLTIAPASGYELAKIEVKDADNQTVELDGDKFTMPASAVKVSAVFKRQTPTSLQSAETVAIYTENGRIVCEQEFRIYDLFGHDVTRMNGSLNGVYIVKFGEKAQKVIVSRK